MILELEHQNYTLFFIFTKKNKLLKPWNHDKNKTTVPTHNNIILYIVPTTTVQIRINIKYL